jgi:non-specific serine/threonine protein kinase
MDLTGQTLSHYHLVEKLGEGGMGAVYRAEDVRLGRHVALKLLPTAGSSDPQVRERFLSEARAVSVLEHPHICMLFEFNEANGQPFLAMQLVEGETLKQRITRAPLSEEETKSVLAAVGSALDAAHAHGIIHRDVKSDNILLGKNGAIKLSDFGVARLVEGAGLTATSAVVGTVNYLAPEQLRGEKPTPAIDQFSLGVVVYECLTGALPFPGDNMAAVMYAVLNLEPKPPSTLRPGLDPAWDAVISRALAKDPAARFASTGEFARAAAGEVESAERGTPSPSTVTGVAAPSVATAHSSTRIPVAAATAQTSSGIPVATAVAPSLAVLYFENLSSDPDSDYFCVGITEDILTDLSKVPGLRVASRNAVARYRGQKPEIARVGSELSVGAVVEGSVRRAGDRVRISAQLIDASNGFQLWADRYDRTLDDVFAVQEDIAHAIATALRGALTPTEAAEIRRGRPAEVEAYDLYLRGRELYRKYTQKDNRLALECFERAVQVDPNYALAWAGIADGCAQMIDRAWSPDPVWRERGFEAARRSIELDPRLAEGHKAEALLWRTERDHEKAVAALWRALKANPRFIPALINIGQEYMCAGNFAGAERALRRSIEVDPAYGLGHLLLAAVLFYTRRYEGTIECCHRAQNVGASAFHAAHAYVIRAHAYVEIGDMNAAEREITGGRAAGITSSMLKAAEALLESRLGSTDDALALIEALDQRPPAESWGCELAAAGAASLRETAIAVRLLSAAEKIDPRHHAFWRLSPDFATLRETKEFAELIGDRGLELVWPNEAPPLSAEERARFTKYEEASGLARGEEVLF